MTQPASFSSVTAICGEGVGVDVSIRAVFDWKHIGDVKRTMVLRQNFADSFEILLDEVPCCDEECKRCVVVLIVLNN